jgi:hypothetical protein
VFTTVEIAAAALTGAIAFSIAAVSLRSNSRKQRSSRPAALRSLSGVPAGHRMALNDLETTSESTSSDTLPVSTRVQAFHGASEK